MSSGCHARRLVTIATLSLLALGHIAGAQCANALAPSYEAPVVGDGYSAQLIVAGLSKPRSIIFDTNGALLVVESGRGVTHLDLSDGGGTCLAAKKTTVLINNSNLTHGIELSQDGKTLYASSANEVFSWTYDPAAVSVSNQRTLIQNMTNADHVTRTLLLSKKQPDILLVSRGSGSNIDDLATQQSSGISQIRAFNLTELAPGQIYDFPSNGKLLGWGLRNSVGVAEEPTTGGIYSVENSADQVHRLGTDIHEDNPGEEMNFHGALDGSISADSQGGNYGYPDCFALWSTSGVPSLGGLKVGSQFSLDNSGPINDSVCNSEYVAPRLTFQAHTAPLDIKFTPNGTLAYITFHGSWNRDTPAGYKLSAIPFSNGAPTAPPDSTTAAVDVLSNADLTACPGRCFRPAGLAIDAQGRVYMTSDSTGEIYVLQQTAVGTGTSY
ncbi:hypothetical protein B0T19DRAFT_483830 [Cercophora scortea]|uniref:Pyrroloquinoline quinone-dependent pyranose dehydrogenase beta-propeller domain-containing protein n=1 Tax=Cercophora scortea TaxID=314031 RepID=A0AAE0IZP7_9PEZI|nr:hypothetical protein B0T19DRAFT_483830 [Cercophora scortea]